MQMVSFRRHIESPKHVLACNRIGIDVVMSSRVASEKLTIGNSAPHAGKFLWALTANFTNSSYVSYETFIRTAELQKLAAQQLINASVLQQDM